MKKLIILTFAAAAAAVGCNNAASPMANQNKSVQTVNQPPIVSSRTDESEKAVVPRTGKSNSTESPMARPIDVAEMTAAVEKAEQEFKKNPNAKDDLAKAYFVRATALTDAAQYRAALGDYRKGLKLNPNEEEARKMHDQILNIFKSIGREPPKEGEEPKPLPFESGK